MYELELINAARAALTFARSRRHNSLIEVLSYYLTSPTRLADKYFQHAIRIGLTCHFGLLPWLRDYISGEVHSRDLIYVVEEFAKA